MSFGTLFSMPMGPHDEYVAEWIADLSAKLARGESAIRELETTHRLIAILLDREPGGVLTFSEAELRAVETSPNLVITPDIAPGSFTIRHQGRDFSAEPQD